jgi:hypothetical protein
MSKPTNLALTFLMGRADERTLQELSALLARTGGGSSLAQRFISEEIERRRAYEENERGRAEQVQP